MMTLADLARIFRAAANEAERIEEERAVPSGQLCADCDEPAVVTDVEGIDWCAIHAHGRRLRKAAA